jgi:hypothetical protein
MEWLKELFGVSYTDVNQFLVRMGTNLIVCIIILFAGFWLAKMLSKGIKKVLRKSNTDEGLVTFLTRFHGNENISGCNSNFSNRN